MAEMNQDALVVAQFGPRAAAYLQSATHRRGEDLERLAQMAARWDKARVLDLGCGGGHASFAVAPRVNLSWA
jgi:tRNA1(Val) A37 N6-methylase TrmN6